MTFQRDSRYTNAEVAGFHDKLDLLDRILTKNLTWNSSADTKGTLLFVVDSAMLGVLAGLASSAVNGASWRPSLQFSHFWHLELALVLS